VQLWPLIMEVTGEWRRKADRNLVLLEQFCQNAKRLQELNEDLFRRATQGRNDSVLVHSTPIEDREEDVPVAFAPKVQQYFYPIRGKKGRAKSI